MQDAGDRPYHHGDLKRAIVDTAMDMLSEQAGAQFTLREVARRAGVSHAAPYKHFPDKASLLSEIALIGFDRLRLALVSAQPPQSRDLESALLPVARAYLAFSEANPALYRLMFGQKTDDPAGVHLNERALGAFAVVIEFLERAQASGLVRERPVKGQAAACWAQMHGLAMLGLDGLLLPEKVGDNAVDAALGVLLEGLAT